MFYSSQILARKGPLGLVWIAAHLDRQLKRQQINSTSIPASVDTLLDSEVPLALRLSGQLLLGVVRIYARKVGYLQQDCNDALVKIRVALRPADGVNLPPGATTAPVEHITILAPGMAVGGRGRKAAAAAAAAAADTAAAGEDAFVIDIEDFYWDQDVLLGRDGAGGFGGFDLNGGFELGLAPTTSGPLSQDISGVFGMHSSSGDFAGQELFDIEDEAAAAVWDLDELEVERLRAAGSQQAHSSGVSGLLGLTPNAVEGPAGKGAAAVAESPDDSDMGLHPAVAGPLDDDLASPTAAGAAQGPIPMGELDLRRDSNAADDLPPTPADGLLSPDFGGDGGAADGGYTAGTVAGVRTPASGVNKLLPPTPRLDLAPAGAEDGVEDADMMDMDGAAAAEVDTQDGQQEQHSQGSLDKENAPHDEQDGAGGAAATPTKTFQRRKASQQQQEQQQEQEQAAAAEVAAAAKVARQRRAAALLGHKKKVIIDDQPVGEAAGGRRQVPTELPAADIRALLADRSPLMDKTRGQSLLGKRQQPEPSSAATAAPTPAELLQLQLLPAAVGASSTNTSAALSALLGGNSGSSQCAGSSAAAVGAGGGSGGFARGLLGQTRVSGLPSVLGVIGGLGGPAKLPVQIQRLFVQAAQAAAAQGGAAAVAPTAALDQIEMDPEDEGAAAGLGGSGSERVTRNSLALSFSTPGSAAAAAASRDTPASATGAAVGEGLTPAAGFGDGFTPGTVGAGQGDGAAAGQQQQDADQEAAMHDEDMLDADHGLQINLGQHDEYDQHYDQQEQLDQEDFEAPGDGAAAAGGGGSLAGGHERLVPWPADAETLMEQPADGADAEITDGGFTSRTRLVMKHLQHAAAAASGPSAAATPASASRRRISAAPPPSLAAAAAAEGKGGSQQGSAATTLSFKALTQGHNRLDACRWFYEVLVLGNKGLVKVKQDEPYGDIAITPNLAAMAKK